jgi:hypothetical protein
MGGIYEYVVETGSVAMMNIIRLVKDWFKHSEVNTGVTYTQTTW